MNPLDYIATGILELYVLGELSEKERLEVEAMAQKHPKIKDELTAIEIAMEEMAFRNAIAPPEAAKEALFAKLDGAPKQKSDTEAQRPLISDNDNSKHIAAAKRTEVSEASQNVPMWLNISAAACLVLAVISGVLAFNYYQNWQEAEDRIAGLVEENATIAANNAALERQFTSASEYLAIAASKEFQEVFLEGLDIAPESSAVVHWNPDSEEVYLNIQELPLPLADQQYQLWAIVDGQPVDIGVFDISEDPLDLKRMRSVANAQAFAITLEPRGGSEAPTMEAMYVIGELG